MLLEIVTIYDFLEHFLGEGALNAAIIRMIASSKNCQHERTAIGTVSSPTEHKAIIQQNPSSRSARASLNSFRAKLKLF